ncbi:AIPR family protein, partial [Leeuwenhoekiella blandensis]
MTKKISNKFIESNLQEFAENNGLESLPEFKQFEHLSNYLTISKYHPEAFDSVEVFESVDMDAGSNFGIDGGAILVNGNLLLNESDLSLYSKSKKLELVLIFNQSKTSANFDSGDIAKLGTAVQNFFEENPKIPLSQELIELKNLYNRVLEPDYIRMIDRKRFPRLEMNFITTSRHQADETTRAVSQQMIKNLKTANEDLASVDFNLLGSDYINDTYEDLTNRYTVKIKFDRRIELDSIKDVFGSYIGYLDFSNFLELVTDQNQEIRNNIFYENVRDFQGVDNKVNTEINETLTSDELRDKFILLNNGITVVTKQLTPLQNNEYELGEFQIVNGCQTSNMLYLNREKKSIQNGLFIPIKLIHTQDNEVISKIVKATNRQTPVPDEAFVALDKYHQNLQKFYELTSRELNEKIYYERRSREYQNSDNNIQKYKIVNVHKQIRAFTAIFLNEPHTVASNHPYN